MDSPTQTAFKLKNPSWPGYVLAGLFLVGLVVMIVLYVKKPSQTTPSSGNQECQDICEDPGQCESGKCVHNCDPCIPCTTSGEPNSGICDATTGECTCPKCPSCENACPPPLTYDETTEQCSITGGDWSNTDCPSKCKFAESTCPLGYYGEDNTDTVGAPSIDMRIPDDQKCKSTASVFEYSTDIEKHCSSVTWTPLDGGYTCCRGSNCT